jgi:hypothetical protein
MKTLSVCLSVVLFSIAFTSCKVKTENVPAQKIGINDYLGQWTLDIKGGSVGWLDLRQESDYLDADLLWVAGSVTPVADVYFANDKYLIVTRTDEVVRKKDEKNVPVRTHIITNWLEISKIGDKIEGFLLTPKRNGLGVDSTSFTGTKLPPVPPAPVMGAL